MIAILFEWVLLEHSGYPILSALLPPRPRPCAFPLAPSQVDEDGKGPMSPMREINLPAPRYPQGEISTIYRVSNTRV